MSSSKPGGGPSPDAIASIITQVPQSGPAPSTRPARPVKASQAKKGAARKVGAGTKAAAKAASPGGATTAATTGPAATGSGAGQAGVAQHESEEEKAVHARDAGIAAAAEQAGTSASVDAEGGADLAGLVTEGPVSQEESKADTTVEGDERAADSTLVDTAGASKASLPAADASKPAAAGAAAPVAELDRTPRIPSPTSTSTTNGKASKPFAVPPSSSASGPPKKKSPGRRLLGILLPCFTPTGHDIDDDDRKSTKKSDIEMKERSASGAKSSSTPTTAGAAAGGGNAPKRRASGKGAGPADTLAPPTSSRQPSRSASSGKRSRGGTPGPVDAAAPTPVKDTTTAAGAAAAAAAANTGSGGVELPPDETAGVLSGAVVPPGKEGGTPRKKIGGLASEDNADESGDESGERGEGDSSGRTGDDGEEVEDGDEEEEEEEDEEDRIIAMGGMGIPVDENGVARPLLAELDTELNGRKCLVLDLDETLVHSSFKMIHQADFIVPVEIENSVHNVYVIKRPGVDQFMKRMGEIYEVVVFTASLSKYADPVLDMLDIHRVVKHRLFRESCYNHRGNYVKDLSQLGRPIGETIIIDNSPASYIFHPNNAVPVSSWFNDPHDTELTDLVSFLADVAHVSDVRAVLDPRLA